MIVKCENDVVIEAKESPYYFVVTIGKRSWYWNKDTGEFDGTGTKLEEA